MAKTNQLVAVVEYVESDKRRAILRACGYCWLGKMTTELSNCGSQISERMGLKAVFYCFGSKSYFFVFRRYGRVRMSGCLITRPALSSFDLPPIPLRFKFTSSLFRFNASANFSVIKLSCEPLSNKARHCTSLFC